MPKYIIYTIRIMLVIVLILFAIACIWRYELLRDKQVMNVDKAFHDIELHTSWTPEELERISERKAFLLKCEERIKRTDVNLIRYKDYIKEQKEFIEECGE